ncbi:MAG: hypothetical protein J0I00_04380 [Burkholderiales bacterium]|nr:hypothetical protein [Burkholderiales bacterium]MBS0404316.1 hypothetical protein [Pseudomonadota bacterium]MBS0415303.1 hypothetical protein [Pseudomonadota bacterium]HMN55894.1 hypothetical protein [Ottowia sp.]
MATPADSANPTVACCPALAPDGVCDELDFFYRLTSWTTVVGRPGTVAPAPIPVEVKLHFHLKRCRGPLALGDLLYTTTLLPGEKVRLFTSDRRSKFTFDSESKFGYRNSQSSEESFFMQQMSDSLFDVNSRDTAHSSNQSHSHVDGKADAGVNIFGLGGSASMSGNFDANSVSDFLGEHSAHAHSSARAAEMGVRKASSVSIGEAQSRTHTESESQDHYESASREFQNGNDCHALTFYFYQINKTQTISYTLESVDLRAMMDTDPASDFTRVAANPLEPSTGVGVLSNSVLSTDANRRSTYLEAATSVAGSDRLAAGVALRQQIPVLAAAVRAQALKQVQGDLVKAGLLDVGGKVSADAQQRYSFTRQSSLPTPGVLVKGCLDECNVCESTRLQSIELDIERKQLENALLQKQITLLEQSQEYRCCPPAPLIES